MIGVSRNLTVCWYRASKVSRELLIFCFGDSFAQQRHAFHAHGGDYGLLESSHRCLGFLVFEVGMASVGGDVQTG